MPRPGQDRRRVTAFSLVELLVVVAVMGTLAALLLPALSRSQAGARKVRCVANLRQLGLAGQMYWDDHEGRTFRYRCGITNGGDLFWFGWLARGAEGTRRFDPVPGALYAYGGGWGVETCPALSRTMREFKGKAEGAAFGYGYNLHLTSPVDGDGLNIQQLRRPSEVGFLADAAQVNTFQAPASPEHPMLEEFYYVNTQEPTAHFRHLGKASVVFCDGHVGAEDWVAGSLDVRLPKQQVGRLSPARLVPP